MTPQAKTGPRRKKALVAAASLVAAGTLLSTVGASTAGAATKLAANNSQYIAADLKAPSASIQAAGSTFVQPFFTSAFYAYTGKNSGVQVNYQGVGSGQGITSFEAGTVNFAASDVPMAASDLAKVPASSGPVIQVPDTLGGVTVSYNLPGVTKQLKLTGPTVVGIFEGTITKWNASQIKATNPGVSLPAQAIVPEVRADSSGTTYIFTNYLNSLGGPAATAWTLGVSKTIAWPSSAVQSPKNSGVASSIKSTPYSIGYVELAYAIQNKFTYAAIKNKAGVFVSPTLKSVAADAATNTSLSPTNFSIVNGPGKGSYPIAGYSWAILLQKQTSQSTGAAVVKVLDWTTHTGGGQDLAASLDYVPLPPAIQNQVRTTLLTVKGPNGKALLTK
jgi:phosphate transport system substrate-binding protein